LVDSALAVETSFDDTRTDVRRLAQMFKDK